MILKLQSLPSNLQLIYLHCGSLQNQLRSSKIRDELKWTSPAEAKQDLFEVFG